MSVDNCLNNARIPTYQLPFTLIPSALPSRRSVHQVRPSPPIELGNGQSPNPGGFSPIHHNPTQCLFVCSTDSRCQQMNFEKSNDGTCACACQICQGQWYGSISDYTKSTPLTPAEMARCPNFVYEK